MTDGSTPSRSEAAARLVDHEFRSFMAEFRTVTDRSRSRFEARDWHGCESDIVERLELYPALVGRTIRALEENLGPELRAEDTWVRVRTAFATLADRSGNPKIARTFFNSVTRRVFGTDGVNPAIEFTAIDSPLLDREPSPDLFTRYRPDGDLAALVETILEDHGFDVPWRDRPGDAHAVAGRMRLQLGGAGGAGGAGSDHPMEGDPDRVGANGAPHGGPDPASAIEWIDVLRPVFYRVKHAYLVGRLRRNGTFLPFILPLLHEDGGVFVDAVLLEEDEASILFSFTRAYFHVLADRPAELVLFLRTILPRKPAAELFLALGFYKHGKTELYRRLARHLDSSSDRFEIAEGERGMVMIVFTLPSYDMVFKIIRDHFAYPKNMTADQVKRRYRLVFERDRVGRLVEAQSFEHLRFPRDRFSEALLEELRTAAARSVRIDPGSVSFDHVYTERRVRPLNLYLKEVGREAARTAVIDYGHAIKELAAANIFPGDFLPKNFGVTRHGRVVFYDYDELCLLTECNFRALPQARTIEDEMSLEPWFSVGPNDVFPEEFGKFLGVPEDLMDDFLRVHRDLLTPGFWRGLQTRLRDGEILDVYPYPRERRLLRFSAARPEAT